MNSPRGFWVVPRMWEGKTVVVMASGPSMSAQVARTVFDAKVPSIAINSTFKLAPFAEVFYAADPEWWQHPSNADVFSLPGLRVSVSPVSGVHRLCNTGRTGYDPNPSCIRTGYNSGYQAIHLAITAGAKRILLAGFNMGGTHWHGKHPEPLRATRDEHYDLFRQNFPALIAPASERGVSILNCTPESSLQCFPFADLKEELCREL